MKRHLLDTHALIWFIEGDATLSSKAKATIVDPNNEILVSLASFWEMSIKISVSKLKLSMSLRDYFREVTTRGFVLLPMQPEHILCIETLPWHHKDPFDRMLIAQTLTEDIPIVSREDLFDLYQVKRIW